MTKESSRLFSIKDDRDLTNDAMCDLGMNPGLETQTHTQTTSAKKKKKSWEGYFWEDGNAG